MSRSAWLPVVGAFVVFVLVWKAIVVLTGLPPFILPAPETVGQRFVEAWLDGTVWPHFVTTMVEIAVGFTVGTALALVAGYGLARSDLFARLASPYLVAAQADPDPGAGPAARRVVRPGAPEQGRHLLADRLLPGRDRDDGRHPLGRRAAARARAQSPRDPAPDPHHPRDPGRPPEHLRRAAGRA